MAAAVATSTPVNLELQQKEVEQKEDSSATAITAASVDPPSGAFVASSTTVASTADPAADADPEVAEDEEGSSSFDRQHQPSPDSELGVGATSKNSPNATGDKQRKRGSVAIKNIKKAGLNLFRSSTISSTGASKASSENNNDDGDEHAVDEEAAGGEQMTMTAPLSPTKKPKMNLKARFSVLRTSTPPTTATKSTPDEVDVTENAPAVANVAKEPQTEEQNNMTAPPSPSKNKKNFKARLSLLRTSTVAKSAPPDVGDAKPEEKANEGPKEISDAESNINNALMSPVKRAKKILAFGSKSRSKSPPVILHSKKKEMEARKQARNNILGRIDGVLGESMTGAGESGVDSAAFLVDGVDTSAPLDAPFEPSTTSTNFNNSGNDSSKTGRFAKIREKARNIVKRQSLFQSRKADDTPDMMMMLDDDSSSEFALDPDGTEGEDGVPTLPRPSLEQTNGEMLNSSALSRPSIEQEPEVTLQLPRPSLEPTAEVDEEEIDDEQEGDQSLSLNGNLEASSGSMGGLQGTITERRIQRMQRKSISPTRGSQSTQDPQTPTLRGRLRKSNKGSSAAEDEAQDNASVGDPETRRRVRRQNNRGPDDEASDLRGSDLRGSTTSNGDQSVGDPETARRRGVRRHNSRGPNDDASDLRGSDLRGSTTSNGDRSVGDPETARRRGVRRHNSRGPNDDASDLRGSTTSNGDQSVGDPETPRRRGVRRHNSRGPNDDASDLRGSTTSNGDQSVGDPETPRRRGVRRHNSRGPNDDASDLRGSTNSTDDQSVGDPETPRRRGLRGHISKGRSDEASCTGNDEQSVGDPHTPRSRGVRRTNSRSGPSDEAPSTGNDDQLVGDPQTPKQRGIRRQNSRTHEVDEKDMEDQGIDPETPTRRRLRRQNSKTDPSQDDTKVEDQAAMRRRVKRQADELRAKEERQRTQRGQSSSKQAVLGHRSPESPTKRREKRSQSPREDSEQPRSGRSDTDKPNSGRKKNNSEESKSPREPSSPSTRDKDRDGRKSLAGRKSTSPTQRDKERDENSRRRRVRSGSPGRSHEDASKSKVSSHHGRRSRDENRTPRAKENRENGNDDKTHRSRSPTTPKKDEQRRQKSHDRSRSPRTEHSRGTIKRESVATNGDRNTTGSRNSTTRRPQDDRSVASGPSRRRHGRGPNSPSSPSSPNSGKPKRRVTKSSDLGSKIEKLEAFEF